MASILLRFPLECVESIAAFVQTDDILNFGAACSLFERGARKQITHQRELIQQYEVVEFGDYGPILGMHPLFFIKDLVDEPELAKLTKHIKIGTFRDWDALSGDWELEQEDIEREQIPDIGQDYALQLHVLLRNCPHVAANEVNDMHIRLSQGEHGIAFALLLTLLPNLQEITIRSNTESLSDEWHMILDRIAQSYQQPSTTSRCLSKLTRVTVGAFNEPWKRDAYQPFRLMTPFLAIPSVQIVDSSFLASEEAYDNTQFQWPYSTSISNIQTLNIQYNSLLNDSLPTLLSSTKSLQNFTYAHGGYVQRYETYQPRRILTALEQVAKKSLRSLYLTGGWTGHFNTTQDHLLPVNLHLFEKLEHIRVDYTLLQNYTLNCDPDCNPHFHPQPDICIGHPMYRLVNILPRSIITVKLEGKMLVRTALECLDGLAWLKKERVPRLEKVALESAVGDSGIMQSTLRKEGVILCRSGTREESEHKDCSLVAVKRGSLSCQCLDP